MGLGWLWRRSKRREGEQYFNGTHYLTAPSVAAATDETFAPLVLSRPGATLVFCWATWCNPCHSMGGAVEAVAQELTDILFVKLNIEEAAQTAAQYNISGTPTFLLFEDGNFRASRFGSLTAEKLKQWINDHISCAD